MLVLVANLGSTSFKFKLLDMDADGDVLAQGGYERIGQAGSPYPTHAEVIDVILKELPKKPDAIGFKAVHGGPISGAVRVTDEVIAIQEQFADVAPAHNPPYIAAMRAFGRRCRDAAGRGVRDGVPPDDPAQPAGVRDPARVDGEAGHPAVRVPRRIAPVHRDAGEGDRARGAADHLLPPRRVVLGHARSRTASRVANSFGMTAQSGVPHCNRVGDFDTFALRSCSSRR
jgi:acetate kinase